MRRIHLLLCWLPSGLAFLPRLGIHATKKRNVVQRHVGNWPQLDQGPEESGGIAGASSLVFGTTVGAGMLALPAAISSAGFVPGLVVLIGSYFYMLSSALLIAESTKTAVFELRRPGLGLLATSRAELGETFGLIGGFAYALIHYCLLVAYSSQGGAALSQLIGFDSEKAIVAFVLIFGTAVALGSEKFVQVLNSFLVFIVGSSFFAVCLLAWPQVSLDRLLALPKDWSAAFAAIPICILALVYHNIVPLIVTQFQGDRSKISLSLTIGSALPLTMFFVWIGIVLAAVPSTVITSGQDPVNALESTLDGPTADTLAFTVAVFKLSAVATSFFGFYFGLRTFLLDVLERSSDDVDQMTDIFVSGIILIPPAFAALVLGDGVFLSALDFAGTFGIPILFGIFPAAIVLSQRQRQRQEEIAIIRKDLSYPFLNFLPGGDLSLYFVMTGAVTVLGEGVIDTIKK